MKVFSILFLIIFLLNSTALAADSNKLSKTVNNFGWNYFSKLDKDKNIFYSPYSIAAAFSIVANGATGKTQTEILNAFNAKNIQNLNDEFKNFRAVIEKNYSDGTILKESDLILIDRNYIGNGINSKFQNAIADFYRAEIDTADFSGNLDAAKEHIKNFVAENTNNFISDYKSSAELDTVLDLLNVIYFKGSWESPFDAQKTWKSNFTNIDGSKSKVQMMAQSFEDKIRYYADEKFMAVEIPYEKNFAAMYIILPRDEKTLNVAEIWDAEEISYREKFLSNLKDSPNFDGIVEVFIPKFELDIKNKLNEDLQKMGIRRAFTDNAEFSNIIKKTQLKISNATHQAKIKVDEEGTEAAAVTEITMIRATATPIPPRRIYFCADRPFLFVIRDVKTEMNLFTGAVNELK